VRVYDATPEYVTVGYTPGYFGAYPYGGSVVWGTGYYYPPWIGAYWWGFPWTYGFGIGFNWSPFWGWGFGIGFGLRPWWPWWGPLAMPHPAFFYRGGYGYGHFNMAHANIYHAWPARAVRTSSFAGSGGFRGGRNNVFSGADGNLYRHANGGWERQGAGGWQRSAPGRGLESERQARESGAQRSQNAWRPSPSERYQPMGPQHGSERAQPRPGPQTVPPGLRGGQFGGGHPGGGGHFGGGGGHGGGGHGGHR
jgi:hypothetical protein